MFSEICSDKPFIKFYRMILKGWLSILILFVPPSSCSKYNSGHSVLIWGNAGFPIWSSVCTIFPTVAPVTFVKTLHNLELQEGSTAQLCCEVSKPDIPVEWKKGTSVIHSSQKCSIKREGNVHTLLIHDLNREDSGEYSCHTADGKTTAKLEVKGMVFSLLSSCETTAGGVHSLSWSSPVQERHRGAGASAAEGLENMK